MSEFVCPNTFCTFAPTLRTINRRGEGRGERGEGRGERGEGRGERGEGEGEGGKYILLERSLHWESKNFISRAIGATRKKLLWQKSKM